MTTPPPTLPNPPRDHSRVLLDTLAAHRGAFLQAGALSLGINLLMLTPTLYMLQVYDRVLISHNELTLLVMSVITLALFALMAIAEAWRSRLLVRISDAIEARLGEPVFLACFASSLNAFSGPPGRPLGDLTQVRQFLTGPAVFAFFDAPWTPVYIGVLYMLHPALGLCALLFAIAQAILAVWSHHRSVVSTTAANSAQQAESTLLQSANGNAEVIESMGMNVGLRRHWNARRQARQTTQDAQHAEIQGFGALSKFTRQAQQSLILGLGALLVIDGQLTAGAMIAANVLMTRALAPIDLLVGSWRQALGARESFVRLRKLLDAHPPRSTLNDFPAPRGQLCLDGIRATATGRDAPILEHVDLKLEPGTVTVALGPSGSGKSTLARVMLGIWPHTEGHIHLDGIPLADHDRDTLGPSVGYLPQDIELLDGSVADNIARFNQPDPDKVIAAAQACGLHEAILKLPRGYDTPVGVNGRLLSGGMCQRIALARAVYGTPCLLVLDEPNANLDEAGEIALSRLVRARRDEGATVFVISHRPAILSAADRIIVLQAGRIRLDGPPGEVLSALPPPPQAPSLPADQSPEPSPA